MNTTEDFKQFKDLDEEYLPVAKHKLHDWTHFAGLYAAEHVAATEFVIGATFVALGAKTMDIILGLLIGNILAVLSWRFITSPIAVETRLSLYTYLNKIAGDSMTKLYNWANVIIFSVISAAMITVSATAVRFAFDIPAQLNWYPTNLWFILIVLAVGIFVVSIALYGFNAVSEFSGLCAPWLFVMFTSGAMVLLPALSLDVLDKTLPAGWTDIMTLGDQRIWTGINSDGESGIGLVEVIGFGWAANTITHFGLVDMALLRFAKKKNYAYASSTGMMFGHYVAWIAAGIMGAGAAVILGKIHRRTRPGRCGLLCPRLVRICDCDRSRLDDRDYQSVQIRFGRASDFLQSFPKENDHCSRCGHRCHRLFPLCVFTNIAATHLCRAAGRSCWGDCVCRTSDFP